MMANENTINIIASHKKDKTQEQVQVKIVRKKMPSKNQERSSRNLFSGVTCDDDEGDVKAAASDEDKMQGSAGENYKYQEMVEAAHSEIGLMQFIQHEYIAKLQDFFESKNFIYICYEYKSSLSLEEYLGLNINIKEV